jgi:nitroreductase
MDAILSRRSIRKYKAEPVPEKVRIALLTCAMSAPSASNRQPWQFVVINDRSTLNEVSKLNIYYEMLKDASFAIAVCGDLQADQNNGFWVQDCSAATQNILIVAQAKGLGAVWLGIYPNEYRVSGIRKHLALPEHIIPLSVVAIGYPAEKKPPSNRYDPSRIHYDQW